MKISYCCKNIKKHEAKAVVKSLKKSFPDAKHKMKSCLGECKLCKHQCFVQLGKKNLIMGSREGLTNTVKEVVHT
ncbi:hypothetical protein [Longirhabdus pacifica]|uniref:hypothetical protein n=1 Tax=Longirhabdus pacifica TaxID=2305227 RepID=UPI001008BD2B|nr:hypothetical protein [Longirhabdus pacifica]